MKKQTKRGGLRNPPGGRPAKPELKYKQVSLKLPPDIVEWLAENTNNRNGFIVEVLAQAIKERANISQVQ